MFIDINDFNIEVDTKTTSAYYEKNTVCDCLVCQNFHRLIKDNKLLFDFLSPLGIKISKPDEIFWWDENAQAQTVHYNPTYTVNGNLNGCDEIKITLGEMNVRIYKGNIPNENTEPYFVIEIYGVILPWKMDELFNEVFSIKKHNAIKDRIFDFFKR